MRVALVHDWLLGMRGGERVLDALVELFPDAEIFTLVYRPGTVSERIESRPIHASFVDRIPGGRRAYRYFLPLFPRAIAAFDLGGFDLVVSSSHCAAKGVRVPAGAAHLCYVHTPMRYVWDQFDAYFGHGRASLATRWAMGALRPSLRAWDVRTAAGVGRFVANSHHVRERIRRCYGRDASVVHPPVEVERFAPRSDKEDFFLVLGALVPYKRVDLAVDAFRDGRRRLVVAGDGPERRRLEARAGPTTTFLGHVPEDEVADLLARARALVLPGVEDFGISVAEALASGTPVVALGEGGVLDTVRGDGAPVASGEGFTGRGAGRASPSGGDDPPPTGVLFARPTTRGLLDALDRFERLRFDAAALADSVRHLCRPRFLREMRAEVDRLLAGERSPEVVR